jgi:Tetratricopeptide repeat
MNDGEHRSPWEKLGSTRGRKRDVLLIFALGFIVFFNSLFNGFVWDDFAFIIKNPEIHSFNLAKIFGLSLFNSDSYFRPLPAAYFSLVYSIAHAQPFLYHIAQLLLHIACTIAVYVLFARFINRLAALLLAMMFLVHPMNVESVAYISATTSQLYALPGLLALLLLQHTKTTKLRHVAVGLLLLASLLAKEEGLLLLFAVLVFVALFRQRQLKQVLLIEAVVVSLYLLIRFTIGQQTGTNLDEFLRRGPEWLAENTLYYVPIAHLLFYEKLLNVPAIILYYLQTFLFPYNLVTDQIWVVHKDPASVYVPLIIDSIVFAGMVVSAIYFYRHQRAYFKPYLFFSSWFIAGLAFHLPIFIPAEMTVADRWFYTTMIPLLGMLGIAGSALLQNQNQNVRKIALCGVIVLIALLSIRTVVRNGNFATPVELVKHDAPLRPNYRTELRLGEQYIQSNNPKAALVHLQNSDRLYRTSRALYDLGFLNESEGNIHQASEYYLAGHKIEKSKGLMPGPAIYQGLCKVLLLDGQLATARQLIKEGLQRFPEDDTLWYLLAVAESGLENHAAALNAIDKAAAINPTDEYRSVRQVIVDHAKHSDLPPK